MRKLGGEYTLIYIGLALELNQAFTWLAAKIFYVAITVVYILDTPNTRFCIIYIDSDGT